MLRVFRELEAELAPKLLSYFTTTTEDGQDATVLYYFLVKIVPCPECDRQIDLFPTRVFSRNAVPRKDPTARSTCPDCGEVNLTTFDASSANCPGCGCTYDPREGNITGATVTCSHCQRTFRLVDELRKSESPLGYRRYAKLILTRDGRKLYEPMNLGDRELERRVAAEYADIVEGLKRVAVAPGHNTNQMLKHNYQYWHQLFSDRQLVCIGHAVDAIRCIACEDLRLLFACLFSGALEFNNLFTSFKGEGTGAVRHMFAHHVLKPEMMPLEANIWGTSKSSGAFSCLFQSRVNRALAYKSNPFELRLLSGKSTRVSGINKSLAHPIASEFAVFRSDPRTVYLSAGDSASTDLPDSSVDLVITDPPFFDNVHYSELADFFYYWLNQMLEISPLDTTRTPCEVQDTDSQRFTQKLTSVFTECRRVLRPDGLFIFTYHHSRHEGWIAVHRAIRDAGFACIQSYPIKAEMSVSMPLQQAKSPIHLDLIVVCRRDSEGMPAPEASPNIAAALSAAKQQVSALRGAQIRVSMGDAKVILMGRVLCETHRIRALAEEEKFLDGIEEHIDAFVGQMMKSQGEVLYKEAADQPVQLTLFDEMGEYLTGKGIRAMRGHPAVSSARARPGGDSSP